MKRYLVFDKNYNFQGYLTDKMDLHLFKKQRDIDQFIIKEMNNKELEKFKIDVASTESINSYGIIMFPEEEIMMYEGFDQMQMDFRLVMGSLLKDFYPFIKFDDDEFKIVESFLGEAYRILQEASIMTEIEDDNDTLTFTKYFDMHKLSKDLIKGFGGRTDE